MKSKHQYLVGYVGDGQCVYGKEEHGRTLQWTDPMTLSQAEVALRRFPMTGRTVALYKLVQVKTRIVEPGDHRRYREYYKRQRERAERKGK